MTEDKCRAEKYLKDALNDNSATFRDGQWESILSLLSGKRVLVVQRTGWGKSMVYFLATKLLREKGYGPTLLISPLLSLMRNQVTAAERIGIQARSINSNNDDEHSTILEEYSKNKIDILLLSPERLSNEFFQQNFLKNTSINLGLLVVDEAHCISDWGHDFRPDYRRIVRIVQAMPEGVPILATTATANDRVVHDIQNQLGHNLLIQRGSLVRSSLRLQNISLPSKAERLAWLTQTIPGLPGSGIVYVLTQRDAMVVSKWLQDNGINALPYHAGLKEDRGEIEQALLDNKIKVLVATVALGMGFDKPDIGFVIHYQRPASVVHYYQQVGRAGRSLNKAFCILLCGEEDDQITNYFIENAFPPQIHIDAILNALRTSSGMTMYELASQINVRIQKIMAALKFMFLESPSPIVKNGNKYLATPAASNYLMDKDRINSITAQRKKEQAQMLEYMHHKGCLMAFLQTALDDKYPKNCGKCMNCAPLDKVSDQCQPSLVANAQAYLNQLEISFEPRKQWPYVGILTEYPFTKKNIQPELRMEDGRALCIYGDAGWGSLVRDGKYKHGSFDQKLVEACADLYKRWNINPKPQWVTCIPSLIHPDLVPDFARRLADILDLPFFPCIHKIRANQQQKTMQNSSMQVKNLDGVFHVDTIPQSPCLLIDDMVDSRWTFTVAAALLRHSGCSAVYPLAIAIATGNDESITLS